jgi:hypothetical protein
VFPPALVTAAPTTVADGVAREVIERGRAYEEATGFFSSVISVQVRDLTRGQTFESRGGLAVHRPDAMRMQMSAAGGVTAIDLLARDGGYFLRLAGRDWHRGRLDETRSNGFPAASLARSFLGIDWSQARAIVASPAIAVVRSPTAEGYALVTLDRRDGTEREVRWFDAHESERARVRFGEYESDDHGVRWPRVVLFWQADPAVSATITVENRTPHPTLPTTTFQPPSS